MKYILHILVCFSYLTSNIGHAQSPQNDGYEWKLLPIPILFFTPETSLGYGGMLVTSYQKAGLPVSNLRVIVSSTLKDQFATNLHLDHNIGNRDYRIELKLNYRVYPLKFFGIGPNSSFEDGENYTPEIFEAWLYGEKKIIDNTYLSAGYYIDRYTLKKTKTDGIIQNRNIQGDEGGMTSGLRLAMSYDNRDRRYASKSGLLAELQLFSFLKETGSDFKYNQYNFNLKYFYSPTNTGTLATQTLITSMEGEASFRLLAGFGGFKIMRGYYFKRYRDMKAISQQAEWRQHLYKDFGATVFAGIGQVNNVFSSALLDDMKTNYGVGLRYTVDQKNRYNLRADFGFTPESGFKPAVYVAVFEAF